MAILESASKVVFVLLAFAACVGFVLGAVTVLIATSIALGLMSNIGRP